MNGWDDIKKDKELILKLLKTDHLNVPERTSLPGGKVRVSVARKVINESLSSSGWFPGSHQYPVGNMGGQYFQLELRSDGQAVLHHNYEDSYLKFKHKAFRHKNVDIAIDEYLKSKETHHFLHIR
jgi:hypothetical protein